MASFVNEVIAKLKAKVKLRGGINGINALAKVLKEFDADASGELSKGELKLGLIDYGCPMTDRELRDLLAFLMAQQ